MTSKESAFIMISDLVNRFKEQYEIDYQLYGLTEEEIKSLEGR